MSWIHCNDCFKQPQTNPESKFVLTSCGRIQCTSCNTSNSCSTKDCQSCRSQKYAAHPLGDSLSPAVADFFCDPIDHLKKFLKVHEFQRSHRDRLAKYQCEKEKQMASLTAQWNKTTADLQSQLHKSNTESHHLEQEILALKLKVQQLESLLAKERSRPPEMVPERHRNNVKEFIDPNMRNYANHSINGVSPANQLKQQRALPDRNIAPGPVRSRLPPIEQTQQPYKRRPATQFLDPETPAFFHSYSNNNILSTPSVRQSNPAAPKLPNNFATPSIQRSHQSVMATPAGPVTQQQQRQRLTYNRVYAFMSAAARQALTPENPQR